MVAREQPCLSVGMPSGSHVIKISDLMRLSANRCQKALFHSGAREVGDLVGNNDERRLVLVRLPVGEE